MTKKTQKKIKALKNIARLKKQRRSEKEKVQQTELQTKSQTESMQTESMQTESVKVEAKPVSYEPNIKDFFAMGANMYEAEFRQKLDEQSESFKRKVFAELWKTKGFREMVAREERAKLFCY